MCRVVAASLLAAVFLGSACPSSSPHKTSQSGASPTGAGDGGAPGLARPNALDPTPRKSLPPAARLPQPSEVGAAPAGHAGGTLHVHLESEPSHLQPLNDPDASAITVTSGLIYQTLLTCAPDGYHPGLAESWELAADGLSVLLHLRGAVRWHDRHAFGVLDVQATLEPLLRKMTAPTMPLLRAELSDIATIELVAERTVRLNLRRPSDLVVRALCDVPILPSHLVRPAREDIRADAVPIARQPIGTGPYRFVSWERGKRIRLARFAESWGSPPAPQEIVFELEPDAVRALNRTRRGELDVLPRVLDVHYPEQVEPGTLRGLTTLYRLTPERTSFLVVNHRRFPLGDARFRRALVMLWDRERFAHELHRDLARPVDGFLFGPPPPDGATAAAIPFDRKRATALLDGAGFRDSDEDGVRDHDRRPIRVTLLQPLGAKSLALEARAFVLEARKAGILIDLIPADAPTILARLKRGDFDMAPLVWDGRADEDPSPLFGAGGAFNFGGYQSAAMNAHLDTLRIAAGPARRRPILVEIARLVAAEQPVLFLYRHDVPALVSTRVHGLAAVGDRLDFLGVWLEK
ncbi:MAG TPA: ABC transporter substrate-binding protein [Polyangia bacterium]|jgi:peptide/nickel transport system substrate-binding protein|nr:ABC transporter substrate-binding protein [Polyangia bacterium]